MKERILTGWNLSRVLYLTLGVFVIVGSIVNQQWFGLLFGGYFVSMGLFALGCAAGNCGAVPASKSAALQEREEVLYEEVESK
jgi:hypothetical protein